MRYDPLTTEEVGQILQGFKIDEPLSDEQINRILEEFKRLQDAAIARGESPNFEEIGNNVISNPILATEGHGEL